MTRPPADGAGADAETEGKGDTNVPSGEVRHETEAPSDDLDRANIRGGGGSSDPGVDRDEEIGRSDAASSQANSNSRVGAWPIYPSTAGGTSGLEAGNGDGDVEAGESEDSDADARLVRELERLGVPHAAEATLVQEPKDSDSEEDGGAAAGDGQASASRPEIATAAGDLVVHAEAVPTLSLGCGRTVARSTAVLACLASVAVVLAVGIPTATHFARRDNDQRDVPKLDLPAGCADDPEWRLESMSGYDCERIAFFPASRCAFRGAAAACVRTCTDCDGVDPEESTAPPLPSRSAELPCDDNASWRSAREKRYGGERLGCGDVVRFPSRLCWMESMQQIPAWSACPTACYAECQTDGA